MGAEPLRAAREALDLVAPCFCAGCGRLGEALCRRCEAQLWEVPLRIHPPATSLPVWAPSRYEGDVRRTILAWKRGRADLVPRMTAAYQALADRWAAQSDPVGVVIPALSGWRRRLSGGFVVGKAAQSVASVLRAPYADVVRKQGRGHSGNLGAMGRSRHAGHLRVIAHDIPPRALLVDDVVTTGVTLEACARSLAEEGVTVCAALVIAATPADTVV